MYFDARRPNLRTGLVTLVEVGRALAGSASAGRQPDYPATTLSLGWGVSRELRKEGQASEGATDGGGLVCYRGSQSR